VVPHVDVVNLRLSMGGSEQIALRQEEILRSAEELLYPIELADARLEDYDTVYLTSLPAGPTGLPPWPDFLARLPRLPVASIALIRGRANGNGSELTLACDMGFASVACIASLGRPAAQNGIKSLMDSGFHKPGDVENRLGDYFGQITGD
jgi:hypothetical protein